MKILLPLFFLIYLLPSSFSQSFEEKKYLKSIFPRIKENSKTIISEFGTLKINEIKLKNVVFNNEEGNYEILTSLNNSNENNLDSIINNHLDAYFYSGYIRFKKNEKNFSLLEMYFSLNGSLLGYVVYDEKKEILIKK